MGLYWFRQREETDDDGSKGEPRKGSETKNCQ